MKIRIRAFSNGYLENHTFMRNNKMSYKKFYERRSVLTAVGLIFVFIILALATALLKEIVKVFVPIEYVFGFLILIFPILGLIYWFEFKDTKKNLTLIKSKIKYSFPNLELKNERLSVVRSFRINFQVNNNSNIVQEVNLRQQISFDRLLTLEVSLFVALYLSPFHIEIKKRGFFSKLSGSKSIVIGKYNGNSQLKLKYNIKKGIKSDVQDIFGLLPNFLNSLSDFVPLDKLTLKYENSAITYTFVGHFQLNGLLDNYPKKK